MLCPTYTVCVAGDERKGVFISRHADVQHEVAENLEHNSYYIIIFKVLCQTMCNGEKGTLTFVHRSHWCTGSQVPRGLGYGLPNAAVWLLWAGKAIARGFSPMAVARDVRSYASCQISGRWRMRCYVTIYVMYRWYKSGCNPVPGSPFASPVAGDFKYPTSQLSHRNSLSQALARHL